MSKERGEVEVSEKRRKSARILALEEEKKEKERRNSCAIIAHNTNNISSKGKASLSGVNIGSFQHHQLQQNGSVFSSSSLTMPPPPPPLKRGRKQKRLEDLDLSSLAHSQSQQDRENHTDGNSSAGKDQQSTGVSSVQWMPEKRILECVLDILQRRDKYKIFAQPVNPEEVETYYTIIKEPMDFGTMRTKLHEGKYTTLEQFESDVFLISSNAMHFNSSTTIYYKEARRLQVLARMVFDALRSDPCKLESQFSPTRGRPAKRLPTISEIKGPRTRLPRPSATKIGAFQLGSRDEGNSTLPGRGRPPIYRPWSSFASENESLVSTVYNAPKILVEAEEKGNYGYKESLLRFAKDLGPTAQKVAARKLINCLPKPPTPSQTPLILPQQYVTTQPLVLPSPSFSQRTNIAPQNAYNQNNTFLNNPLLNLQPSTQENSPISPPIDRQILKTNSNLVFPLKEPSQSHDHVLGKRPILMDDITSTNFNLFDKSSTGNFRTNPGDQNMSATSIRQNVDPQQPKKANIQNSKFWLASHLRVFPVYDPNTGRRFMRTVDMIAEANKLQRSGKQILQTVDHDHQIFSNNWQSMLRGKQQVVDDHDEQLSGTNRQSWLRDFVHRSNNTYNLKPTSGKDRFMEGFGNGISSLQMPLNHNYPLFPHASSSSSSSQLGILPLYNETSCIVHDRAGASSSEYHDQGRDISTQELLLLKDAQQPDLALQL